MFFKNFLRSILNVLGDFYKPFVKVAINIINNLFII